MHTVAQLPIHQQSSCPLVWTMCLKVGKQIYSHGEFRINFTDFPNHAYKSSSVKKGKEAYSC